MMSVAPHSEVTTIEFSELGSLSLTGSCLTIGNFDGVHLGHQAIIKQMVQETSIQKKSVLVVTFFPNPADFFRRNPPAFYLSSPREKETLLLSLGVGGVITFRFDRAFSQLSPDAFLSGLHEHLGMETLVVGHDFALGKDRVGTIPILRQIGQELGFSVRVIAPIGLGEEEISSTRIRRSLDAGDMRGAAAMLGRLYEVSGSVTHGSDRGARIGLPTANIAHWPQKKLPSVGVYVTRALLRGKVYQGITNVGYRPTFEQQELPNIETHILDFDGNIYGEKLTLQFIEKIRDEQKFESVEAFLAQIEQDKITARRIFRHEQT